MFEDSEGFLWFGGDNGEVHIYNGKNLEMVEIDTNFFSARVLEIQEDKMGNIYFDSSDGVRKFDGTDIELIEESGEILHEKDWELHQDDLWFRKGFNKEGVYRYDGTSLDKYPGNNYTPLGVYEIYKDKKGNMWFGTADAGVARFDGKTLSWLYEKNMTTTPEGGSLGIRSVIEDKKGKYWFTNFRKSYDINADPKVVDGLNMLDYSTSIGADFISKDELYALPYFQSLEEDSQGNIWAGSYSEGIYKFTDQEITHYPVTNNGQDVLVFAHLIDSKDRIWLMSHEHGIFNFNGTKFVPFLF